MAEHTEITPQAKVRKIKKIMKRTGLGKNDANKFLELMLRNERFQTFKGKAFAFKLAKRKGITIDDAMKMIMKRRKQRAEETSLDNLTGASQKVGELETQALEEQFDDADGGFEMQSLEEQFDDFEGGGFIQKNRNLLIVVGIGILLLFTKQGKELIKKLG